MQLDMRPTNLLKTAVIATLILGNILALPAVAQDEFAQGRSLYSQGKYASAIVSLQKYLAANPGSYQGYYMLANCYVQVKDLVNAKHCYALTLTNQPDNTVREHCLQAIERIGLTLAPPVVQKPTTGTSGSSAKSSSGKSEQKAGSDEDKDEVVSPQRKRGEEEIARIMADAKVRADRIREEQKEGLERYKEANSRWFKVQKGDTYERVFGIKPEWETEFLAPYDLQIQKIMDDAEHRCNGIRRDMK